MNIVAIWGAGSGLGAVLVEHFHKMGFKVIAIVRNPDKNPRLKELGIETLVCDATEETQVKDVVEKLPLETQVISSMGSYRAAVPVDYIGHRYLIDALVERGLSRFLLVTSLGCSETWRYMSERSKAGFGAAVREKTLAEAWLQTSNLNYTIVRPGGLKDGVATGTGELSQHTEVHGLITRGEVARLIQNLLDTDESISQTFQCVDTSLTY
ncbi:SDR family NAD(P)-dependent oxidoreductase [Veronia pacifica]|uniref:Flavin reductase n=1 Tax=Veronia pacifica TaxID=1080227 RepID=A0A1C3ESK2_9GAMM|nr:SDR family NAD(P)-dependent oxidoreductase [Veronia pacifica]ODA36204.1 flavin reductase [Veronia pacifica]